jgi:8-oxo-dGTP pyrophosphatase MutT (NUDIX family)
VDNCEEIERIAAELQRVAALGLNFARSAYDEERFQAVLRAAAHLQALADGRSAPELLQQYRDQAFGLSALPSAEAVVFDEQKRLLLVQRRDDRLWALPGGITDPGETLAESARRELAEETGLVGTVQALWGLFDSRLWHSAKRIHFYHALFLIDAAGQMPRPSSEVLDVAYFAEDQLPPLSPGHHLRAPFVFKQYHGEAPIPFFDRPVPVSPDTHDDHD